MEKSKTKKEIVKMLLNKNFDIDDEEELMEILIDNHIAVDVDKENEKNIKIGDKIADKITSGAGSWTFIIVFMFLLFLWILLNVFLWSNVDPYPFILLNLLLSCLAALQAPIIMMSQNRASKIDRKRSQYHYKTDLKSELILEELHHQMAEIIKTQRKMLSKIDEEKDIK